MQLKFYKQPFRLNKSCDWVYDADGNFVMQFELYNDTVNNQIMAVINDEEKPKNSLFSSDGCGGIDILGIDGLPHTCIIIRGWGNLTGTGAHNLSHEEAIDIQDNFVEWLLYKLNKNGE